MKRYNFLMKLRADELIFKGSILFENVKGNTLEEKLHTLFQQLGYIPNYKCSQKKNIAKCIIREYNLNLRFRLENNDLVLVGVGDIIHPVKIWFYDFINFLSILDPSHWINKIKKH